MAEEHQDEPSGRRLSLSERAVRDIVENAVLKLQIELAKVFAPVADVARLEEALKVAIAESAKRADAMQNKIDSLETDKAGREAVQAYKKWLTGGAVLATVFMAIQVAISIWLVTRGAKNPNP